MKYMSGQDGVLVPSFVAFYHGPAVKNRSRVSTGTANAFGSSATPAAATQGKIHLPLS